MNARILGMVKVGMSSLYMYVLPQGLWRMQVEHACSHLKAYALSSPDFQSSMGNPQMGKVGIIM